MRNGEFEDPRLVEVYDAECVWGVEDDLFLALVAEVGLGAGRLDGPSLRVADLGCGTGRFTLALADAGHAVTGIDPAVASLERARGRPGAERVTWIVGTASALPATDTFDVVVLTSHVAQFLVGDDEWADALGRVRRALVPGGRLAFESRDPLDRRWERWNPVGSRRRVGLADGTAVDIETEVTDLGGDPDAPTVALVHRYAFADGARAESRSSLRFRTESELRATLVAAGLTVDQVFGGWRREPVGESPDGELIVVARRS